MPRSPLEPVRGTDSNGRPTMISVIIPVLNEEKSAGELHRELVAVLSQTGQPYEIIFINDGSRDNTLAELKKLSPVTVISFSRTFGKSQALQAGFDTASGDVIITMDGDLQDDPHNIPAFLAALANGVDLVCGWKQSRCDFWSRRLVSRIANTTTALATGVHLHDMNCGFKAYRAPVAKTLCLLGDMHRYIPAIAAQHGFRVAEIPVSHRHRKYGDSKYGIWRLLNGFFDFMTLIFLRRFTDRPMYLFGLSGLFLHAIGGSILLYLAWIRLVLGIFIFDRPLLMLGVLLTLLGFQSFTLGFLAELVIRQSAHGRTLYTIKETFTQ